MSFGAPEAFQVGRMTQVTPQQVAITQRSTQLISGIMVDIVGGRNNPEKGLPVVRNTAGANSAVGSRVDYQA